MFFLSSLCGRLKDALLCAKQNGVVENIQRHLRQKNKERSKSKYEENTCEMFNFIATPQRGSSSLPLPRPPLPPLAPTSLVGRATKPSRENAENTNNNSQVTHTHNLSGIYREVLRGEFLIFRGVVEGELANKFII